MRYLMGAILFFALTPCANAGSIVIFSRDGRTATVLFQGGQSDPNAAALFSALAVPAEEMQGRLTKKVLLAGDGHNAFSVLCAFSKLAPEIGSCTVVFRASPALVEVLKPLGRARLLLSGEAAAKFAQAFVVGTEGMVFRADDGKLQIAVTKTGSEIAGFAAELRH